MKNIQESLGELTKFLNFESTAVPTLVGSQKVNVCFLKTNNVFIAPKPYDSWSLNDSFDWEAPTSYPDDGKVYNWDDVFNNIYCLKDRCIVPEPDCRSALVKDPRTGQFVVDKKIYKLKAGKEN